MRYGPTLETDQGPVSFQVSGRSTLLGMPAGAPRNAYDKADQTTTCNLALFSETRIPSV